MSGFGSHDTDPCHFRCLLTSHDHSLPEIHHSCRGEEHLVCAREWQRAFLLPASSVSYSQLTRYSGESILQPNWVWWLSHCLGLSPVEIIISTLSTQTHLATLESFLLYFKKHISFGFFRVLFFSLLYPPSNYQLHFCVWSQVFFFKGCFLFFVWLIFSLISRDPFEI